MLQKTLTKTALLPTDNRDNDNVLIEIFVIFAHQELICSKFAQ